MTPCFSTTTCEEKLIFPLLLKISLMHAFVTTKKVKRILPACTRSKKHWKNAYHWPFQTLTHFTKKSRRSRLSLYEAKSHWSQMQFPSAIRIIIDKIAFIGLRDIFLDDDLKMQYRITIIHYFPKCHPKPIKMHLFVTVHNIVFLKDATFLLLLYNFWNVTSNARIQPLRSL